MCVGLSLTAALVATAGVGGANGPAPATVIRVEAGADGQLETRPPSLELEAPAALRRLLVKFRPGQGPRFGPETESHRGFARDPDLFAVTLRPGRAVADAVRGYRSRPDVLYAEPDYLASVGVVPNDPRYPEQWSLPLIGAPSAWDTHTDAGDVVVAVIDTGVDFDHPDLAANLWTEPGTGAHGFTFEDGVETPDGSDDYGHGTHVAGIIGAAANNAVGIAGLNWSVQILSLRFIGANGFGNVSDAILAFDKIVELRQAGHNIRVSNNSWSIGAYSQALEEAIERARAAGVLHVCAAGNYVGSIDTAPIYPAAYDGAGILTVNATTQTDGHATFSGVGLARVDLAAPGVDILSTVPPGPCTLCDPSGYLLASGTSMAAPHVTGVLAAAFHLNPGLAPEEARDVVLDPASYVEFLTGTLASWNSTGGRLDFAATLDNPALYAPPGNSFPAASTSSNLTRSAGDDVTLSLAVSDPDGDPLRGKWARPVTSGLVGYMLNNVFPGLNYTDTYPNPHTWTAPSLARPATSPYTGAVADGRGGSALDQTVVTVLQAPSSGLPPTAQLAISPTEGPVGTTIELTFTGSDPEGGTVFWGYDGNGGACCRVPSMTYTRTMSTAGVYRFQAGGVDDELQVTTSNSVVVRIGGAVGEPPVAVVSVDVTDGPVPLTVNFDGTASYDPDGGSLTYTVFCDLGSGWNVGQPGPPTGSCTYDDLGPRRMMFHVRDDSGHTHSREVHIMATAPADPDATSPAATITAPVQGAVVGGPVNVDADASDDVGVARVDFLLDGGELLGSDTTAPFGIVWDASAAASGSHSLTARAWDAAGNEALSGAVGVTVDTTPPAVAVTEPAPGASVGGLVNVSADASDDVGVAQVEFLLDGGESLGTDTTEPYGIVWDATSTPLGAHTLTARARDLAGNETLSAPVDVTVIDVTPPAAPTGLTATAGPAEIALDWDDGPEGDLGAYRVYRSTTEGGGYAQVGGDVTASAYLDTGLAGGTRYYYVVTAVDVSGNESAQSAEASAVANHVNPATADFATPAGTVSGTFVATQTQDDAYQGLREELSGGKPANRYSLLEHVWRFDVVAGASYSFHLDAYRTPSADGDDFLFEYSTDASAYAPMLTVTATTDDDAYQVFGFPGDVAGTLYVRATDTDRTAGNQALDTLWVDHMFVTTVVASGPDVTPPNPPTGLAATPGDGVVDLDWADNAEPDLAGYHVYRSTTAGGPYTRLTGAPVAASSYGDTTVVNGTTYHYVVSAEDVSGNESGYSQEVSATPQAGGATMHVDSIVLSTVGGGKVKGRAVVTIVDQGGSPVAGATVTGTFSGDFAETLSAATDASGAATLTTSARVKTPVSFSFCVDDASHASFGYDPASNVETCEQLN